MSRIAFFGTPQIARTCLEALFDVAGHEIVCVVAQQDKPRGRGQRLEPPPTKELALERGVEVLQPATLKKDTASGEEFFRRFVELRVDLAIVVAYGRILPKRLLDQPPRGFVNVHASLLPRWRGAAPIQRAIAAGDPETGVCLMRMVPELDAGDVFAEARTPIHEDDDGETLSAKLAALGGALLRSHLDALAAGSLSSTPQAAAGLCYAEMLHKGDGALRFESPAFSVSCQARAVHPWPGAFTTLEGEVLKLYRPRVTKKAGLHGRPGTVLSTSEGLEIACGLGAVSFAEAQLPNKRRMPIADLVRGRPIAANAVLASPRADASSEESP